MRSFSRRLLITPLLLVALVGACSGGDDGGKSGTGAGATAPGGGPAAPAPGPHSFAVSTAAVEPMAPQAPNFPPDVTAAVTASLNLWLENAIAAPLRTGKPSSGLDAVFTEPALLKVSAPGPERAAVLEEGTPLTGDLSQDHANAKLTLLTAPGGEPVLVTAQIDIVQSVKSGDGAVDVVRGGELVLVPDRGSWRIDSFDVVAKHDTRAK
ncbi:MAG: hypothetical protein ACR2MO_02395 [Acidimicrobiales bacterium]